MEVLKKNTIEPLIVSLRDRLETITSLISVTNLKFDVIDSAGNPKITNGVPSVVGMNAVCLIDTSTGGGWGTDMYRLYLKFTDGSANPILAAGKFRVEDD